jgi:hypothetical protein
MNGTRYRAARTPEGRIAARIRKALFELEEKNRVTGRAVIADYHELENFIRPETRAVIVDALIHYTQDIIEQLKEQDEDLREVFFRRLQAFYQELATLEAQIEKNHH